MIEIQGSKTRPRAVLAGLNTDQKPDRYAASMEELRQLAEACELEVVSMVVQNAASVTQKTLLGRGKVEELHAAVLAYDADIVIFQENLTPMQVRNLEDALDTEVLDRTGIILQIFSTRARTREARLQVKSAQLQYVLPRLAGMRKNLGRQGGGSGRLSNKGAGEEQLELDRRHIERQLAEIRRQLKEVEKERSTQRGKRCRSGLPLVSLVGYTNAGKSTIMNGLLSQDEGKRVFEKDMLFATLDTAVRSIHTPGHRPFLLSDTVGFIADLPHTLVDAFRSTLEEACYADLLIEVVDFSDPEYPEHLKVTRSTLEEIGAGNVPILVVYNKIDRCEIPPIKKVYPDHLYFSAKNEEDYEELLNLLDEMLGGKKEHGSYLIPYSCGALIHEVQERYTADRVEYLPEGILLELTLGKRDAAKLEQYRICCSREENE
jgi:GTPase